MMDDSIKHFLQYVFQMVEGMERVSQADVNFQTCDDCGTTFGGFKKSGKFGCANCYLAFREQLAQIFRNIHYGADRHVGKVLHGAGGAYGHVLTRRELEDTRRLLKQALETEAYEDAARYRDIINTLAEKIGEENA